MSDAPKASIRKGAIWGNPLLAAAYFVKYLNFKQASFQLIAASALAAILILAYNNQSKIQAVLGISTNKTTPNAGINPKEFAYPTINPLPSTVPTYEIKSNDPNVQCNLYACGTISMSSSQCKLSGCCTIGNQNVVMTDQNKCTQEQQAYASTHQQQSIQQPNYPVSNMNPYNNCMNQEQEIENTCNSSCSSEESTETSLCQNEYGYHAVYQNSDSYSSCLNDATTKNESCLNNCTSTYQNGIQSCLQLSK